MRSDDERGDQIDRIGEIIARNNVDRTLRERLVVEGSLLDDDTLVDVGRTIEEARDRQWRRLVPSRYHLASLGQIDGPEGEQLADWAQQPRGRNLVITGSVGVGKTHAALAACRIHHDAGLDVAFWPTGELLDALRPGAPSPLETADLAAVDRLILDDLGMERASEWTMERLGIVVSRRWMEDQPTIATTNLGRDALIERFGERTFSRLIGDAVVVRLAGDDRRMTR